MYVAQAGPDPLLDVLGRLDVGALHVDHADADVLHLPDLADQLELGEFTDRHLEVDLIRGQRKEGGEHRGVAPRRDGAAPVVSEAQVCAEVAAAGERLDGPVEDLDEP